MADRDEQVALLQIGIVVSYFLEKGNMPDTLDGFSWMLSEYLDVDVTTGMKLTDLRTLVFGAYLAKYGDDGPLSDDDAFERAMKGV